jgi:hypothetical protein
MVSRGEGIIIIPVFYVGVKQDQSRKTKAAYVGVIGRFDIAEDVLDAA